MEDKESLLDEELMQVLRSRKNYQSLEGMATYWDCGSLYVAPKGYIVRSQRRKHLKQLGRELLLAFRDNALYLAGMAILAYVVLNLV